MSWFSKSLFTLILLMSSILGVSMNNMILSWSFMEINLLSFIPLITLKKTFNPHMKGLKYFLIQSLGSIFLLVSILLILILNKNMFFNYFMMMSLLWKMGIPPFHFWLLSLMIELNWFMFFILSSWQKILPLYMVNKIYLKELDAIIMFSLIICVSGVIFQSSIKKLMIFSSIFMMVWIFSSMIYFKMIWILLLFLYSMMFLFFVMFLLVNKLILKESENYFFFNQLEKFYNFFIFLSMAGIPPSLGFFMKIWVLFILMTYKKIFLVFILVVSSILMMYMYISIFLNSLSTLNSSSKMMFFYKSNSMIFFMLIFIISPMLFLIF